MGDSYVLPGRAVLEKVELFLSQMMTLVPNQQLLVISSAQKLWLLLANRRNIAYRRLHFYSQLHLIRTWDVRLHPGHLEWKLHINKKNLVVLMLLGLYKRILLPEPFGMGQRKVHHSVSDLALDVFISCSSFLTLSLPSMPSSLTVLKSITEKC